MSFLEIQILIMAGDYFEMLQSIGNVLFRISDGVSAILTGVFYGFLQGKVRV
jgi:hypothetical protein